MADVEFKFTELKVYQKSLEFIDEVYDFTKAFPSDEQFGLTSQYWRAALSVALNLAEGSGSTDPHFNRYLLIAQGSIKEGVVCSTIATRQQYFTNETDIISRLTLSQMGNMITTFRST